MATAALSQETANTIIQTLQPIRDLTKNWDIDIAGCLDEYLQDLELSAETREQLSTHKFAEAALVLHNSSGVYSRKVDYLHSYAHRVLRELAVQHGAKQTNANKRNHNNSIDKDVERFLNFDPNQDFLLLDDVVPFQTDDKVNLKETSSSVSVLDDTFLGTSRSTRRLSVSMVDANVQRIGSILNSTQGLRLSLGQCDVDDNGMCWLPGSQSSNATPKAAVPLSINQSFAEAADDDMVMDDGLHDDHDDGDDDVGGGFEMAVEPPSPTKKVTFAPQVVVNKEPEATIEKEDPWKLLDPHVPERKRPRPMRIGKTLVLPSCMKRLPSEQRKKKDPIPDYLNRPLLEPVETEPTSWTTGKRARETLPLRGLAYGNEFAYIAKEIAKRKSRERKNKEQNKNPEEEYQAVGFGGDYYDDGDNDDDGGFPAFDDNDGPIESNTGIGSVDDLYGNKEEGGEAVEGMLYLLRYADLAHLRGNSPGEPTVKPPSFEELCREHIRRFAKGAERYAVQTKLSERVDQWQSRLRPLLDEEELRPAFDIHEYGEAVIHDIEDTVAAKGQPTKTVDFADVTRNCSRYEVCRRFLASLSLVNSGNIRLADGPDVQFELIRTNIERPMETFLAPSTQGNEGE